MTFHFGNDWRASLASKVQCRNERLSKYYQSKDTAHGAICLRIIDTLCAEHPQFFNKHGDGASFVVEASHTGDRIAVSNGELDLAHSKITSFTNPCDLFDVLAMQVPEDLVIQQCSDTYDSDYCARIHLCHANGWSAEWAVGKSFDAIHARIPRITEMIRDSSKMLRAIVESPATLERVGAVNFKTSGELNRHPDTPSEKTHVPFHHLDNPNLFLRFERQCVIGFKAERQFLFTIRTYLTQISPQMPSEKWNAFKSALVQNSDGTNPHKFLESNRQELALWAGS